MCETQTMSRKNPTKGLLDILPKATLYTYAEMRDECFGFDRREVKLLAWGFTTHGQFKRALRVISVPKGAKEDDGGLSAEGTVFTLDFPVILHGWGHPVPPPPFKPDSGGEDSPNEEFADMLLSYYRTVKPSVLLADFTEHHPETRTPLIPQNVAEAMPRLGGTDDDADAMAPVHLFLWDRSWHWYVTEYDPERQLARGLVVSPFSAEVGDFAIEELDRVLYSAFWKPKPLSVCQKLHARDE
jgi:hypothetical protein